MKTSYSFILLATTLTLLLACGGKRSQAEARADATARVEKSIKVLDSMLVIPEKTIPEAILKDARGIAVIPGVVKASMLFGGGKGQGVMSVRRPDGTWSYPVFISSRGTSLGPQFGVQVIDLVLVFRSEEAIEKTINNQLSLGVSASAAAGPVGRSASAQTNSQLNAQIYSYARSRGVYVGATLDGGLIRVDDAANAAFYQTEHIPASDIFKNRVPPGDNLDLAAKFDRQLNRISQAAVTPDTTGTGGKQAGSALEGDKK
jgi:lipid-binding SYLF domain-containing protein